MLRTFAEGRLFGSVTGPEPPRVLALHGWARSHRDFDAVVAENGIESLPALEIDANDVAVSHAATVGSLDEDQLFYVQTRGIARRNAERMIALAFFEPAIARFPTDALRDEVRTSLDLRLEEVPDTFVA